MAITTKDKNLMTLVLLKEKMYKSSFEAFTKLISNAPEEQQEYIRDFMKYYEKTPNKITYRNLINFHKVN